jgi:hypothetical protein
MLPVRSSCKKIRDVAGHWKQIEIYIHDHSEAEFSHSICPDCAPGSLPGAFQERQLTVRRPETGLSAVRLLSRSIRSSMTPRHHATIFPAANAQGSPDAHPHASPAAGEPRSSPEGTRLIVV